MPWNAEMVKADGSVTRFTLPAFSQEVNAVCASCNNGWMNDIEKAVQPFLGPMLGSATLTRLHPSRQSALASWAVKTAFMLQQIHPRDPVIPPSEYARFYAARQPPEGYVVWIGHRAVTLDQDVGLEAFVQSRQAPITRVNVRGQERLASIKDEIAKGRTMFRSVFAIGRVSFAVFGHNFRDGAFEIGVVQNGNRVDPTRWIWPIQGRSWWPPSDSIKKIGGFDGWYRAFDGPPDLRDPGSIVEG